MSLERRVEQMRREEKVKAPVHLLVANALKKDSQALYAYFGRRRSATPALDEELIDVYELRPEELPELTLPNDLSFVAGFSYVACHWYPFVRIAAAIDMSPSEEQLFNSYLEGMFRDSKVTKQDTRDALKVDQSGATLLEQWARVEFREGNLELIGARKAINGARRMFEQLIVA